MDYFIGSIELFAFDYAPYGFMLCDGTQLSITQNTALYSLIGITYGGDGSTNFCLPNLLGTEPIPGMRYYIAVYGLYPTRP